MGYGYIYPATLQGRLIALALMFVGIGFLALLTAAVASRFVKQERGDEHAEVMKTLRQIQDDVAELKPARDEAGRGRRVALLVPTALDNGHRSQRKLLRAVVARLLGREALSKSMRGFRKARQLPGLSITRFGMSRTDYPGCS